MRADRERAYRDDIRLIADFAAANGLTVVMADAARRLVKLSGPARRMEQAFRTSLHRYRGPQQEFRGRSGVLHLPQELANIVELVLGLDTRPMARPRLVQPRSATTPQAHLPNQFAALYDFPAGLDGSGQTIALIELGGGFSAADTRAAFDAMKLTPPRVVAISVDQVRNAPSGDGADGEVALDIQVAGGAAPGAEIAVYFAPNTDAGFADALSAASQDTTHKPSVISISWGSAEARWTAQAVQTMNSLLQDAAGLGISVFAAAGDSLATDGIADGQAHVDFPASSPWAIGCGGTATTIAGNAITAQRVWNDGTSGTGGGISDLFDPPDFQRTATLPPSVNGGRRGRGVPDVAGNAAPESGYAIIVGGQEQIAAGTSAVAPLWAGLAARINQKAARPVGFFLPAIYGRPQLLTPVTQGSNRAAGSPIGYDAGPGWSACTGLGTPRGQALADALAGTATDERNARRDAETKERSTWHRTRPHPATSRGGPGHAADPGGAERPALFRPGRLWQRSAGFGDRCHRERRRSRTTRSCWTARASTTPRRRAIW